MVAELMICSLELTNLTGSPSSPSCTVYLK